MTYVVADLPAEWRNSIVAGGPLYSAYVRLGMMDNRFGLCYLRVLLALGICWLPLVVMTSISGSLLYDTSMPFLEDAEAQARLLIALPLLILAEVIAHNRLAIIVGHFRSRGIVVGKDLERFDRMVENTLRLRNSYWIELALFGLAFLVQPTFWQHNAATGTTWYSTASGSGQHLTLAGFWYAYVSRAIFRFLLFRWYFRVAIWFRLLFQISKLPLKLNGLHPDCAAGLGFLRQSVPAMAPLLLAHTVVASAMIADQILYNGAKLVDFRMQIIAIVALLLAISAVPLYFFTLKIDLAKRASLGELGRIGTAYVNEFWRKWMRGEAGEDEPLIGTADIQSLADIANSYGTVVRTKPMMPDREMLWPVAAFILLPFVPLLLTTFSLEKLVENAVKLVL
jgi:hypothetical protein